jgi:hypothetical protein
MGGWVNNVGIAIMSNLHEPKPAEVERLISVNLMSHYWGYGSNGVCSDADRTILDGNVAARSQRSL